MKYLTEPKWFALNIVKEGVALGTIIEAVAIGLVIIFVLLVPACKIIGPIEGEQCQLRAKPTRYGIIVNGKCK